jgi:heptosyltransferase-3
VERLAAQVVLVGAEDAKCAAEEVQAQSNKVALNLVGKTSIGVLGELLRRADLVVGNDSGPIHIAAAVGTSGVVVSQHPVDGELWVVNSPNRYRPWGVRSIVLQPPTGLESCVNWPTCLADDPHCILSVSEAEVAEAAMMLLATDGLITNGS